MHHVKINREGKELVIQVSDLPITATYIAAQIQLSMLNIN